MHKRSKTLVKLSKLASDKMLASLADSSRTCADRQTKIARFSTSKNGPENPWLLAEYLPLSLKGLSLYLRFA